MREFDPVAHMRRNRWLAKKTIQDRLRRLGWKRFNGGDAWDAYYRDQQYDPCNTILHITWGEYIHQVEMSSRNWRRPSLHFKSYAVRLDRLAGFDQLTVEADRLDRLHDLDTDDLGWREV